MRRRRTAGVLAAAALVAVWPSPAVAVVPDNPLGCHASALVERTAGPSTFVDAADVEVRVPRHGQVTWRAAVGAPAHDEAGDLRLRIGFWDMVVARWGPSANPSDLAVAQDARALPGVLGYLPPGRYRLRGVHRSAEGRCEANLTVLVAGSSLTNGLGAAAGLVALALGLGVLRGGRRRAGRARGRPVAGAVVGLLCGATLGGLLLSTYLVASDSRLLWGLPMLLLVAGLALGAIAPFGDRA